MNQNIIQPINVPDVKITNKPNKSINNTIKKPKNKKPNDCWSCQSLEMCELDNDFDINNDDWKCYECVDCDCDCDD